MTIRDFFFQIVLFLLGATISLVASISGKETQKKIALSLGFILVVVSVTWAAFELSLSSFSREDVSRALGERNWRCFPDRLDGVAFIDVPQNYVVQYPISNVDKEGIKYNLGEVVPASGSATAWLQGKLRSGDECP